MEVTDAPEDEGAAMDLDEDDRAEAKKEKTEVLPKWAHRLDPSCKRLPTSGLINCDADETAAQIIDGGIMANIILLYGHYYNNRIELTPEEYHKNMLKNDKGRLDLDGICPYVGENKDSELELPDEARLREYFDMRATTIKWLEDDEKYFGARPWEFMMKATHVMVMIEKMMCFLVESGFKPEGLAFLKPMDRKSGNNEQRAEFRKHVTSDQLRMA